MTSAFTPLEALLLFQYLSTYGVSPTGFTKISDLLKNDAQIRRGPSFDAGRLSPDVLRDYYLRLLKDEARSEIEVAEIPQAGANSEPGSRKRKAPSPTLPTIQEASKNSHLIPQLVRKLYARYREHAIIEIKAEERTYEALKRDITEIESGAWDERLQREIDEGIWDHVIKRDARVQERKPETEIPTVTNGMVKQSLSRPPEDIMRSRAEGQPTTQPDTHVAPPHAPRQQSQQPTQPPNISPRQPVQQLPYPPQQPIHAPHSPYPPHSPYHGPPSISPRPHDAPSPMRAGQSPSMLPPPPPVHASQPIPPYPYGNNAQQQRPPSQPVYQQPHTPQPPIAPHGVPYQQYPMQHQSPYVQTPYSAQPGGVMLQPFAVAPQAPSGPQRSGQTPQTAQTVRPAIPPRLQMPAVAAIQSQPGVLTPLDIAAMLGTPERTRRFSAIAAPSPVPSPSKKDTGWRQDFAHASKAIRQATPPRPRNVSPTSDRASSPPPETSRRTRRGQQPTSAPDSSVPARSTRRRARGGSTTSSVPGSSVRGPTRSPSVMSHAEDISMLDTDSVSERHVKHEPSTPMDSSDVVRPTTEGTPGQSTRRAAIHSGFNKRKRGQSQVSEASEVPFAPRQDKTVVIANRNFNRLSQTIMNDIQSHKHASLFSNPVRDRDAEGYSDIIKRPQDLKSIRTAITAGNRAVNTATTTDSFASSTSSQRDAGGTVSTLR